MASSLAKLRQEQLAKRKQKDKEHRKKLKDIQKSAELPVIYVNDFVTGEEISLNTIPAVRPILEPKDSDYVKSIKKRMDIAAMERRTKRPGSPEAYKKLDPRADDPFPRPLIADPIRAAEIKLLREQQKAKLDDVIEREKRREKQRAVVLRRTYPNWRKEYVKQQFDIERNQVGEFFFDDGLQRNLNFFGPFAYVFPCLAEQE